MPSERVQRQIDRFLDQAEEAMERFEWERVQECARAVLGLDPENEDGKTFLAAAERNLGAQPEAPQSPSPAVPESFANGRYQVKRFLGEGGKKRVYLAHDTLLDRDVAFALIKTEGLDAEGRERIIREAQAMGKLGTHPHLVSVFDMGEEPDQAMRRASDEAAAISKPSPDREGGQLPGITAPVGQPYLVTELMGGGDVEGLLEKAEDHRLPIERAVELAVQICRGLEFAHEKGLVHRDLKPGNVWLMSPADAGPSTGSGNGGQVAKIGDFGLAVALDRSRLTQAGMMVGTVGYMPPEQAMGGEVTPRSDLYSLGAMLYEMVCGRPPFVGEESVAVITQHLNTPPVAPAWHREDCPVGLEALILRLLEKDASKRPDNATTVRVALEAVAGSSLPEVGESQREGASSTLSSTSDNPLYRRTFVGREQELRQLQAAFDGAVSGQGALQMVVGEPGIGKTALCEQLATYAGMRGGKALVGHCYEEGSLSLPYLPFVEAIRSYVLTRESEALRSELGAGATDVARIVSEVREKVAVEPRVAGDPEDDRWRLYQAVTGFLRNASAVQPLVLVLEDLHWADRGTLDFLVHLSRNLEGARLLIVGTYRDVEVDRAHPLSPALAELRRGASFGRIALRGLTPDEVQRMLGALATHEVPWSLAEAVHRQTEGNPLFIQEVLRYLVEEGHLGGNVGQAPSPAGGVGGGSWLATIPEGLRDVIGKRLSRLSAECNRMLAIAAVIGRAFSLDTLQAAAGMEEEPVVAGLEEAVRIGILEDQTRPGSGHARYRFAHAFFRQTLYEELSTPRRIRLHQQVAAILEQQYGARLEEHAAELAEHFAYHSDPAGLAKAVAYGEMAAQRALGVFAYGEAVRVLEKALEAQEVLDPDDRAKRCDLLLALGEALLPAGQPLRAAMEIAEPALALAETLGDQERCSRACRIALTGLDRYGAITMQSSRSYRQWAERADRYAAEGTIDRAYADLAMAGVRRGTGQLAEGRRLVLRALDLARRLGDVNAQVTLSSFLVMGVFVPARHQDERLILAQEAFSRNFDGAAAREAVRNLYHSGRVFLMWGDRPRAEELWRRSAELAQRVQDAEALLWPLITQGFLLMLDGELDGALATGAELVERGDQLGSPVRARQFASAFVFRSLLWQGRYDEALSTLGKASDAAGLQESNFILSTRGPVMLASAGRMAEARARWQKMKAGQNIASAGVDWPQQQLLLSLEAAVLVEDREAAATLASLLTPTASLVNTDSAFTPVARHLGAAAALLGKPEEARAYYLQAIEACEKIRFRPEIALTRLELAELLLGHYPDERAEALEHLDFAIAEFQQMKMQPALERALKHKGLLRA